jgi:DNA-binding NarL/FixJ family response regulator
MEAAEEVRNSLVLELIGKSREPESDPAVAPFRERRVKHAIFARRPQPEIIEAGHRTRLEIVRLFALGKTTKEVALTMKKAEKTIEYHKAIIARDWLKTPTFNIALLTHLAIATGLVKLIHVNEKDET